MQYERPVANYPCRRTGDAEYSVPETSTGTRDVQVFTSGAAERRAERVETVDTGTHKSCM